jgi:mono/diheme cytochrome c family protein
MIRKRLEFLLVLGTLATLIGCAGQVPQATALQAQWAVQRWPGTTPETLVSGRTLYIAKCSGCHTLRLPSVYSQERWPVILDKMQKRAKITDDQKEQILHYVLSVKQNP